MTRWKIPKWCGWSCTLHLLLNRLESGNIRASFRLKYTRRWYICLNIQTMMNKYITEECVLYINKPICLQKSKWQIVVPTLDRYWASLSLSSSIFQLKSRMLSLVDLKWAPLHPEHDCGEDPVVNNHGKRRIRHHANGCLVSSRKWKPQNRETLWNLSHLWLYGLDCVSGGGIICDT